MFYSQTIKEGVIKLRKRGLTYLEIKNKLSINTPKATISYWCKNIKPPKHYFAKLKKINTVNLIKARKLALQTNKTKRIEYLEKIKLESERIFHYSQNKEVAKIILAMLYLSEGTKNIRGSIVFGNSNPNVIKLFLYLLRSCYQINESKFRCTVQCRADQNTDKLEKFWSETTKIGLDKFYNPRIDKRTIGQTSRKLDYKGVCRINYFSAHIFWELTFIAEIIINRAHSSVG